MQNERIRQTYFGAEIGFKKEEANTEGTSTVVTQHFATNHITLSIIII